MCFMLYHLFEIKAQVQEKNKLSMYYACAYPTPITHVMLKTVPASDLHIKFHMNFDYHLDLIDWIKCSRVSLTTLQGREKKSRNLPVR